MTDLFNVFAEMQRGQVLCDCNNKFNELLKAVLQTGKKGEISIKVFINPAKFALGGGVLEVNITHEAKIKRPELPIGAALFFVDQEGALSRTTPDQNDMFTATTEEKSNGRRSS